MSDNKRNRRSFTGTGYYIALILCAAAIGISGYLYYRNETDVQEVSVQETLAPEPFLTEECEQEDLPVLAMEPTAPAVTAPVRETEETAQTEPAVLKTVVPVKGTEAAAFCVEALSYNETTRDWRIHDGVDLAAEEGTQVCASADGKVYTTYDDDSLGTTVVIRHQGGYTTRYSSLSEDLKVKAGDQVSMGQPIGTVGTTALVEAVIGPHLHFSVSCQNQSMDPAEFWNLH